MTKLGLIAAAVTGLCWSASGAYAQGTVECHSRNYQYDECWAGPLHQPQLIHQLSGNPCILNRTWGYNPRSKYLWVAEGCAGVFADVAGYHHGRGDTFDPNARAYSNRGHDIGAVTTGLVVGALLSGMNDDTHSNRRHSASNVARDDRRNGCHGEGCLVDNPDHSRRRHSDRVDRTPQFDRDGNPNFDVHGNYQGCHGMGCLVDNPD